MNSDNDDKTPVKQIGAFITIPFVLAVPPVVGWFIGYWLDGIFGLGSFFSYTLMLLGFIAGFREVYRIVKRFGDES